MDTIIIMLCTRVFVCLIPMQCFDPCHAYDLLLPFLILRKSRILHFFPFSVYLAWKSRGSSIFKLCILTKSIPPARDYTETTTH